MIKLTIDATHAVTALLDQPAAPVAGLVLAHGAGAGMRHAFLEQIAAGLAARRIATLRYNFPFMGTGASRPDRPALAQATVRAAVTEMARHLPETPLFAGGKSFGGRMTSQAQAAMPLPLIRGLVFFGFPLHPAKRPATDRADHLAEVAVPMLFLQGTRDTLGSIDLIRTMTARLGARATLHEIEAADHSFHVPVRSGMTDATVLAGSLDAVAAWMMQVG